MEASATPAPPEPPEYKDYAKWLKEEHNLVLDSGLINRFNSNTLIAQSEFAASPFWKSLRGQLAEADATYQVARRFQLLDTQQPMDLHRKPYKSFLLKTYRKNCRADSWPDEPAGGWLLPDRCFDKVNDLVRTTLVVKYLDGVEFLVDELDRSAKSHGLPFRSDLEAREEGYYAAHAYVTFECGLQTKQWEVEQTNVSVEFQITTQIQEVIRRLTHENYESRRAATTLPRQKWQWDYRSTEFKSNYLSHILHYVEGMIMEVREAKAPKQERDTT